ncbi:UBE2O family protein [Megaselia abdita]
MASGISTVTHKKPPELGNQEIESPAEKVVPPLHGRGSHPHTSFDNQYFYEDEVFKVDKKGRVKFGVVTDNSEAFYSDEDSDDGEILSKGEIRVLWHPDGKEEVLTEQAVGLADRTLMPGDVVRRLVAGKDTQRGYCREINMKADVKVLGTKFVVQGVNAERLKPVNMPNDNAVCLDSWVGSTKEVEEVVTLRSSCGAVFEVPDFCLIDLKDVHSKSRSEMIPNGRCFYPGQILVGKLGGSLDQIKYVEEDMALKKNKKGVPISKRFFVDKVEVVAVHVHWQCKALSEEDAAEIKTNVLQQPDAVIRGETLKRLRRLNLFEACTLQINDKNFLNISDCDNIVKKPVWEIDQAFKYKLFLSKQQLLDSGSKKPPKTVKISLPTMQYDKLKNKLSNTNLDVQDHNKLNPKNNKLTKLTKANLEKFNNPPLNVAVPVPVFPVSVKDTSSTEKKEEKASTPKEDWQTEDELEGFEDEDEKEVDEDSFGACGSSTGTTVSTCSTPTPKSSPKRIRLQKKNVKKLKKSISCCSEKPPPATGDKVVTEALVVYSSATVVWQDGTVERDIPSTELYPIHHLDDHEFFPGDFVLSGKEEVDVTYRDYGVIQNVDHQGRTANVKWFTTYTAVDNPKPTYKGDTEESVYDLKDHPDFQYRPGTIVIRVANFVGDDANCTAGQIIDNYKDGQVKVWWVDGHISMSWPQDLFEVAHIDDTQEFWGGNNESDDSWETESETSEPGEAPVEEKPMKKISELISNLERARIGFTRLEEILCMNPNLQSRSVMRKLLQVYKVCRFIDKLINCTFFHEDNFMGLLERVRKGSNQTERAQDQRNRLFNESPNPKSVAQSPKATDYTPKVLFNVSSTPFKKRLSFNQTGTNNHPTITTTEAAEITAIVIPTMTAPQNTITAVSYDQDCTSPNRKDSDSSLIIRESSPLCACNQEKNRLLSSVMMNMEKVVEKSSLLKLNSSSNSNSQDDSGNCSRNDGYDGSSTSYASSNDLATTATATSNPNADSLKTADDQKSISCSSIELAEESPDFICARLCSLLQIQLNKCLAEIQKKYCKDNFNLSEVIEFEGEDDEDKENVWEENDTPSTTPAVESEKEKKLQSDSCDTITTISEITQSQSLEAFQILTNAPSSHKFHLAIFHTTNSQQYYKAIQREHRMLKNGLPPGVWVRAFEDRMDLMSVMIEGPKNTPYEDGMFFFDIQLGKDFPKAPPLCHYISYCSDRLNPNLYEDGKVCVSLLGTWSGRDTEVWGPNSTLLQVIVSIQGLILVAEPYFNEAGYEKQKGTQHGLENSRMYNEMVIIKLVQAMTKLVNSPPEIFRGKILTHFSECGESMYQRIKFWMELSKVVTPSTESKNLEDGASQVMNSASKPPEFPLVPASRGFCLTLAGLLENFLVKIKSIDLKKETIATATTNAAAAKTPKTECDSVI